MELHNSLRLYIQEDAYHIAQAAGPNAETLTIKRKSNEVSLTPGPLAESSKFGEVFPISGVFGIISLLTSDYLIIIKSSRRVAQVLETDIHEATDFGLYPIDPSAGNAASSLSHKTAEEKYLLGLVKAHLYSAPFYFTYGSYDLTTRLQAQATGTSDPSEKEKPLWERADDRFFWNRYLQSRLIELTTRGIHNLNRFILPVMFGFCEFRNSSINGHNFIFGVISRRSRYRAGTRYFSRGIDQNGNVSNFNETEMMTLLDHPSETGAPTSGSVKGEVRCSYVQIRGSVPLYWAEINTLRYKPDLKVMDLSDTTESLRRHFEQLNTIYGDVYALNLVNQKGYEKPVKEAFEKSIAVLANPKVHYTYFDFHHECKGLRFDRVSVLLDSLEEEIHTQGFFMHDTKSSSTRPGHQQTSVMRTNCMDCLDRTNVVQSALANFVLVQQLKEVGILKNKQSIDDYPAFIRIFRNVWADNANVISNAYSGSGALKTDYTRTGVRTKQGALQDGYNSLLRYFKNNYLDGPRQDSFDLVTGAWSPRKGGSSFLADRRPLITQAAPYALLFLAFVLFTTLFNPSVVASAFGDKLSSKLFLLAAIVSIFYYITAHGVDYVAWPRLNSLNEVIAYSGKGYESKKHGRGPAGFFGRMEKSDSAEGGYRKTVQGVGEQVGGHKKTTQEQQSEFRKVPADTEGKKRVD